MFITKSDEELYNYVKAITIKYLQSKKVRGDYSDIIQECYIRVWKDKDFIKNKSFVYSRVISTIINIFKSNKYSDNNDLSLDDSNSKVSKLAINPENKIVNKLFIKQLLSMLSHKEKSIIIDYYINNLTFEQVGKKYGFSRQYAEMLIKTILRKVRENIKQGDDLKWLKKISISNTKM